MAKQEVPKSIRASLYIDGKPAQNSIKNTEQVVRTLRKELNGLTIGTAEWNAKMNQLKVHQATLNGIRREVNNVGGAFAWLKTEVGKFGALAAGYLGFQFITTQFQNIIAGNAKLSDSLADIRRVAGFTEVEVRKLDKSFGALDTRTSKSGLRDMAVIAGKLGVAKDEILGFVTATDKLVVALGDELGDADSITTQLGKILNVFDGEVTGDNITRLGNAMVKLANDGVASAGFISDFTQRVSGIAKTANMALGPTMGLAAGLEELGARPESAATAIQKLLVTMAQDIPQAAKVAGVGVAEFNEMFSKSPELALLAYAEGLTQNKNAFSDIAVAFKDAGEEGVRVVETITKLGERADFMRTKFEDGATALQGYNEIMTAFEMKNETMGAKVDKLGKTLNKLTMNQTVVQFLVKMVDGAISATAWIERNASAIATFAKVLTMAVVSWIAYNLAVKITTASTISYRVAAVALALAKAVLTGNTIRAAAAMRMLNITMKANPIGLLVSAITAASAAFFLFSNRTNDAEKAQESLYNMQLEAEKATVSERLAIERAQRALRDDKISREEKLKVVKELRDIMPNVLKNYSDEEIMAGRATKAITDQTAALLEQALIRKQVDRLAEIEMEKLENKSKLDAGFAESGFFSGDRWSALFDPRHMDARKAYERQISDSNKRLIEEARAIEEAMGGKTVDHLNPFRLKDIDNPFPLKSSTRDNELLLPTGLIPPDGPGGTGDASGKTDKIKAEQDKLREMLQKNMNDIYIDSLEGAEKELAQLDQKYDEMRKKAGNNKTALLQLEDQYNAEFIQLLKRTTKVADEEAEKRAILEAELVEEKEKAIHTISMASMSDNEREIQQMRDHYRELIELAEKHGLDVTSLKAKWAGEEEKLLDDHTERKKKEENEAQSKERDEKYGWAIESAKLVSDTLFSISENRRRAELDSELHQIDKEREAALSAKNLTEEQKNAINERFDQKAKVAKQKAFKADQRAAITQAIINGLVGIGQLWIKPGFPAAIPLAAMLGAQTAANVATIASQKAPEYATGGFSDKDPAGYVSNSTLFNRSSSGRPFVAGEAGKEWIAPNWMVNSPKYANIIGMLESARQEKRFFAGGGSTEVSSSTAQGSSADWSEMKVLMIEMIRAQREANDKEVLFVNKNYQKFNKELTFSMKSQGKS